MCSKKLIYLIGDFGAVGTSLGGPYHPDSIDCRCSEKYCFVATKTELARMADCDRGACIYEVQYAQKICNDNQKYLLEANLVEDAKAAGIKMEELLVPINCSDKMEQLCRGYRDDNVFLDGEGSFTSFPLNHVFGADQALTLICYDAAVTQTSAARKAFPGLMMAIFVIILGYVTA